MYAKLVPTGEIHSDNIHRFCFFFPVVQIHPNTRNMAHTILQPEGITYTIAAIGCGGLSSGGLGVAAHAHPVRSSMLW